MEEDKQFHTVTSNWSESVENTLRNIYSSCIGYKWMNIFGARKNEKKYNILMYCSIVIGPIAGILSATSSSENNVIQPFVTIFSFLSGVTSAIIKFSEFGEKALVYKTNASKYASLEMNIQRQLSLSNISVIILYPS